MNEKDIERLEGRLLCSDAMNDLINIADSITEDDIKVAETIFRDIWELNKMYKELGGTEDYEMKSMRLYRIVSRHPLYSSIHEKFEDFRFKALSLPEEEVAEISGHIGLDITDQQELFVKLSLFVGPSSLSAVRYIKTK